MNINLWFQKWSVTILLILILLGTAAVMIFVVWSFPHNIGGTWLNSTNNVSNIYT